MIKKKVLTEEESTTQPIEDSDSKIIFQEKIQTKPYKGSESIYVNSLSREIRKWFESPKIH